MSIAKVMELKPVSYRYNWQQDSEPLEYGLIAEDAAKVDPNLVLIKDGQIEGIYYQKVFMLMLKAMQEQEQRIVDLEKRLNAAR